MLQLRQSSRSRSSTINYFLRILGLILFVCVVTTNIVSASTHPFISRLLVGGDTIPPTVPDPLLATPIAPDQIDLVWGASTDNVGLAGYRVFRDLVQIATTTLTTFSDIGLLPETTYTYTVDAFDVFYIFSSSSIAVSTTTLSVPIVIPPATSTPTTTKSESKSSGTILFGDSNLVISPLQFAAKFAWTTNTPTRYSLRWGRTDSYESGSVLGGQFNTNHQTVITDLEPATKYYYELEVVHSSGVRTILSRGDFVTLGSIPVEAVPNVSQVRVMIEGNSVRLEWKKPSFLDFSHIRIIRSHLFYPQHANDGALVYEGQGSYFFDSGALQDRSPQYYTIFVYDRNGRISSGAVVVATRQISDKQEIGVESTDTITGEEFGDQIITEIFDLFAMNVILKQNGLITYLHEPSIFNAVEPLFISIPVGAVPKHLKSIVVSMTHPSREQEVSTYLLKINPAGTAYEALLPAPLEAGQSKITIRLYDYELAIVRIVSNTIQFKIESRVVSVPLWLESLFSKYYYLSVPLILLFLGFVGFRWWRVWRGV